MSSTQTVEQLPNDLDITTIANFNTEKGKLLKCNNAACLLLFIITRDWSINNQLFCLKDFPSFHLLCPYRMMLKNDDGSTIHFELIKAFNLNQWTIVLIRSSYGI